MEENKGQMAHRSGSNLCLMKKRSLINFRLLLLLVLACFFACENAPDTLYQKVDSTYSKVHFTNQLQESEDFNIIEYLYYYNGGGVAIGDVNNDGLPDLYFTGNQVPNKLYLNKGNLQFEDATAAAGLAGTGDWKTGVTMADVNADGWLDIYVCQVGTYKNVSGRNELFINNQDGAFTERAGDFGLDFKGFSTQAAFFDYDIDGDLDMFLLNHSIHAPENYSDISIRAVRDSLTGDRLYRNDAGRFIEVTESAGIISSKIGYGLGIALGDVDNNGCPDMYIANDFHENDYLYYNNCDGTFTERLAESIGHTSTFSMGCDIADFNNDGLQDIFSLDMKPEDERILKSSVGADPYNIYQFKLGYGYHYQYPRNALQLNQGQLFGEAHQFSEIAQLAGVEATDWSWSGLLHDMDNDGWKDLYISNGILRRPNDLDYLKFTSNQQLQNNASNLELAQQMPPSTVANYAFRNRQDLTFENTSQAWGLDEVLCSNGAAYADLDLDGDLDLVVNNLNAEASIFENTSTKHHFLQVQLEGDTQNPFGIGAKVEIHQKTTSQTRENFPTRGFQSVVEPVLHFGLGENIQIDSLVITWQNGMQQVLKNMVGDRRIRLNQTNATHQKSKDKSQRSLSFSTVEIPFENQENNYNDFDYNKLLLQKITAFRPKIALGQTNVDARPDMYVTGASGEAGQFFLQGKLDLEPQAIEVFEQHRAYTDTDATFFDADGDGDEDLYVVSGGLRVTNPSLLQDRLYLNDGNGNFSHKAILEFQVNGNCVAAIDKDKDGDLDVFVGSQASSLSTYGFTPDNYWLINDGKANFELEKIKNIGMVTDAVALDGQLIVVGNWMPITIIEDDKITILPNTGGWWNCVETGDIDGDGDQDLLVGNRGINSDLRASAEEPARLYINDFDENGTPEAIVSYYKQGKEYSFASKDELVAQMLALRKRFPDYAPFANATLKDIFEEKDLKRAQKKEVQTFASIYLENTGNGFEVHELPLEAQFAPIYDFAVFDADSDDHLEVLAVGNFYKNQPNIGRFDASYGCFLKHDGAGEFRAIPPYRSGFYLKGELRILEWMDGIGLLWK